MKAAYYNEHDKNAAAWIRELIKAGLVAPGDVDERSIEDVTPNEIRKYTQWHFYAGIAVWSYSLRRAGWPDDREVCTFSCPCQPFSAAGKGEGFADERHLWPATFHLIEQLRPVTAFGEQVSSKDGLTWIDLVQDDLEGAGYTFRAIDIPACSVGAPHRRNRFYFVADRPVERSSLSGIARGLCVSESMEMETARSGICLSDNEDQETLGEHLYAPGNISAASRDGDGSHRPEQTQQYEAESSERSALCEQPQPRETAGFDGQERSAETKGAEPLDSLHLDSEQVSLDRIVQDGSRSSDGSGCDGSGERPVASSANFVADAGCGSVRNGRQQLGTAARGSESQEDQRERLRSDNRDGGATRILVDVENSDGSRPQGHELQQSDLSSRSSEIDGLDNTIEPGLEGFSGDERNGNEPGRIGTDEARPITEAGPTNELGDSGSGRSQGGQSETTREHRPPQVAWREQASNAARSVSAGPTNGFWRDAEWIYCRDEKYRAIEPGTFPLATGSPARVGRLRGYGNSIVSPLAEEFIKSYLDTK